MTAACTDEIVKAWACDEISKLAFGDEYHVMVGWGPAPAPGGPSGAVVPAWYLALTTRNPMIGEPRLCHTVPIGVPEPDEVTVRKVVGEGIRLLRDLAASKLAGVNGNGPAPAH